MNIDKNTLEDYFKRPIKDLHLITQGTYGDKIEPFIIVVFSDNVICIDYRVYKRHHMIYKLIE